MMAMVVACSGSVILVIMVEVIIFMSTMAM
jgi:hypothetical protein